MAIPITFSQYNILSQSILLPNKTNFFFQQRVSHKLLIFLMSLFLGPTQWPSISAVFIFLRVKKIKVSGENLVFYLAHFFSLFTSLREGEIFEFCQKSSIWYNCWICPFRGNVQFAKYLFPFLIVFWFIFARLLWRLKFSFFCNVDEDIKL